MPIKTWGTSILKIVFTCITITLFTGCNSLTGVEIARLKINKVSTASNFTDDEVTLELKKGDEIALWSDMDMEYDGDVNLRFRIKLFKDGIKTSEHEIDPTKKNITIGEVKSKIMNKTKWSFSGKNSEIRIEEDGNYTIKSILVASKNPSLKVNKAELVLKK